MILAHLAHSRPRTPRHVFPGSWWLGQHLHHHEHVGQHGMAARVHRHHSVHHVDLVARRHDRPRDVLRRSPQAVA